MVDDALKTEPLQITITSPASSYKDILVHLDGSAEDEVRLSHAEMIAARFGAKLVGIYTNELPEVLFYMQDGNSNLAGELTTRISEAGRKTYESLQTRFSLLSVLNEVRKIEEMPSFLYRSVAIEARCADLFIASCPYDDNHSSRWNRMIETIMFEGGHGLLLVPRGVKPKMALDTLLVAWNDSREATRAISEALPLLSIAKTVQLSSVREFDSITLNSTEECSELAIHLARHGVQTNIRMLSKSYSVSKALLKEARRISADLVVMGAYGHSRLREWMLGGTTYELLRSTDVPILLAN